MLFAALAPAHLDDLATALARGRITASTPLQALARQFPRDLAPALHADLARLFAEGMSSAHLTLLARALADERRARQHLLDRTELVWSGPDAPGVRSRDTAVVVRDLCRQATSSVLIANFAFDRPEGDAAAMRARDLWRPLAERMRDHPALDVRLIVNIERGPRDDQRGEHELRARFLDRLRRRLWPGDRLPELFYDPRALHPDPTRRASQHAKIVLVDRRRVFLTSANFTQAGQQRNIEAGLLHDDPSLAQQIAANFDALIQAGALARLDADPDGRV